MPLLDRLHRLLPGLWAGFLICIAAVAAPVAFAVLERADAGRVVNRLFVQEAYASLLLAALLLVLERRAARSDALQAPMKQASQFSPGMVLALLAMFCTVAGYFAVQPMLPGARLGQGPLSFGQWHAVSVAFFLLKMICVAALAWRATASARVG